MDKKLIDYYDRYDEQARLASTLGQIEFSRTQNIISRYLKPPPATVLDVGGAAGRYSCWLATQGYEVHLVDPVPRHIEQARQLSEGQPETPITSCRIGDARQLEFKDEMADAVLLLGPLYHLVEKSDQKRALIEAYRVLKPGGYVFAAGISRFASTIDGLMSGYYLDPIFQQIILGDLATGQHHNPTDDPAYFMDTFFHHPDVLNAEVSGAGFEIKGLLAVEGIVYMLKDIENTWDTGTHREFLLEVLSRIEQEPSLIGASPHLICVGVKL
jgi:ubiquinone/menaquinone biosynthesis C-methylase UbiE